MIRAILRLAVGGIVAGLCLLVAWTLGGFAEGNPTWHGLASAVLSLGFVIGSAVAGIGGLIRFVSSL